ncbi:MAG: c-type cytochrome [Planctomycetaceae bacterium]
MSSITADRIALVLRHVAEDGTTSSEDLWKLVAQATAMGQDEAAIRTTEQLVSKLAEASPPEAWTAAASAIPGMLRNTEFAAAVQNGSARTAFDAARTHAAAMALDVDQSIERRVAALTFLGAVGSDEPSVADRLVDFFLPSTPPEIQQAAVAVVTNSEASIDQLFSQWKNITPAVRSEIVNSILPSSDRTRQLIAALESKRLASADLDAVSRDRLLTYPNSEIQTQAAGLFGDSTPTARQSVVDEFRQKLSEVSGRPSDGKAVFEKRCATCHRLQDVGKQIGADLAALKDRSTPAMLTAILDPNKAVEAKFLSYTAVTSDGLSINGMLLNETGNSLTLLASDGKEHVVARTDIDELIASGRSLMPEGLEKDLSPQDLADVIAFVQSSGTPWKLFDGNSPAVVAPNDDGSLTLPATAAEIYGPNLVFEQQYENIGWWQSTDDYAVWNVQVPKSGHWTVEFDFACDNSTAGNLLRLSTGTRMLTARVPGTGTWNDYRTSTIGTIDLHAGRQQLTVTAIEQPSSALIDLRAIRLIPPK